VKSGVEGFEVELVREKFAILEVKSGRNWDDSAQHATLKRNYKRAVQAFGRLVPKHQLHR